MSQYLQMMHYVKEKYHPDIIVVVIVHNDFLESIHGFDNYAGDFLQLARKGPSWIEIKPRPFVYKPSRLRMLLKNSAIVRYFYCNLGLNKDDLSIFRRIGMKGTETKYQMNVDVDEITSNIDRIKSLTLHIFSCFKETAGTGGRK